jgi:hypothetical protein
MSDPVNHPTHYQSAGGIECIEALESLGLGKAFCTGNAIKYLWRLNGKGKAVEDARKAQWYVQRLIEILEKEATGEIQKHD